LKFTHRGSVTIKVKITEEPPKFENIQADDSLDQEEQNANFVQNHYLQISVIDTGVGIKKEDQQKLFKLFGFLDNTKKMNT
jgi:signal transduction histidine kinase